jgi:Inner centromere protein, ARK binding region
MLIKTVTQQHQMVHTKPDMSKFANARIPFADAPNPPGPSTGAPQFKTPGRPAPKAAAESAAKSSPHYPPGDSINLPEIATDSEDEDSENEFAAPDWVNSPALREMLTQQQLMDPEQIFGPIAPLQMEEVFKNKNRHKKFRERTSSAVWTSDKLTEEERKKDKEARERLIRDGGWTFQPDT